MKRLFSCLLVFTILLGLCAGCTREPAPTTTTAATPPTTQTVPPTTDPEGYEGATVILYSANVRGNVAAYSAIAAARASYEAAGATVYLVDAGNYLQGSAYAAYDMGATIYQLMEAAGYDVAGLGIYDLVYGEAEVGYGPHGDLVKFYTQAELYRGTAALTYQSNAPWAKEPIKVTRPAKAAAGFSVICSNLRKADGGYYDYDDAVVMGQSLQVGFVSCLPENAAAYLGDGFLDGYAFTEVAKPQCDVLVSLGGGEGNIVIEVPADGTLAVGAYVIYPRSGKIAFEEVSLENTDSQMDGLIAALTVPDVIGTSDALLNGSKLAACNGQTDLGKLVADALKWYGENKMEGINQPVIGLFNGGNCRNFLYDGEITQMDLRNALHGSQEGVGVVYLTGLQLLEMLEAATQRENCFGWAQVSGISYEVNTTKPFDFGPAYGLYYKVASINRVSITGGEFNPNATYAVVADMLLLKGEETYYLLAEQQIAVRDTTGADICQIVAMYIREVLDGQVKVEIDPAGSEEPTQQEDKAGLCVTLDANGGRISPYHNQRILQNGQTYGTLPTPIREGYKFLGWYTEAEGGQRIKSTTKFTANADQTLYAHWEYDAMAYWSFVLENRVQQIPQCRRVVVYLERNAGYKTYIDCPFLTDAGAINPAEGLIEYKVTDDWIQSVNPYIIVKLTTDTDMSPISKIGMLRRFPNAEIYIFSTNAVSGNEKTQLYCRLYLAKLLYPEYFEDVDLDAVKAELKVKTTVYY